MIRTLPTDLRCVRYLFLPRKGLWQVSPFRRHQLSIIPDSEVQIFSQGAWGTQLPSDYQEPFAALKQFPCVDVASCDYSL